MANSLPPGSKGTIPVADAKAETAAWRDYLTKSDLVTKAFLFSMDTITNMLSANAGADGVRVYLALKTAGDPTSLTALLVPTLNGNDLVVLPKAPAQDPGDGGDGDDDSNVFNNALPCPPVCDDGSGGLNG